MAGEMEKLLRQMRSELQADKQGGVGAGGPRFEIGRELRRGTAAYLRAGSAKAIR
ncbi:hypothetical protein BGW38_000369 [Lunasporangiospora selenospora]|uniref:Uncharacterized protein n=1 Tax=Lunasporangiospora selenospora TaxID=979761 RepID=A0A9P6G4B1_9FUNG|nr:hypothetical protein BGW38_000369 [Lunasporangiospora selenospora]